MARRDWAEWHRGYDDPGSLLSRRLELVQGHLRAELERAPAGDVRLVSLCAGQGRDVIGALAGHSRRDDVRARLVELDERNATLARQAAQAAGLPGVEVLQADAGITNACAGAVPAQIVVACGIFGNISDSDIQATVAALPGLCASGALVLWTRHRRPPDLTPAIRSWFGEAGFREEAFDTSPDGFMSVGAHRLAGEPAALVPGQRLFTFRDGTELGPQLDHVSHGLADGGQERGPSRAAHAERDPGPVGGVADQHRAVTAGCLDALPASRAAVGRLPPVGVTGHISSPVGCG
jgi:hypothetical protein